MLDLSTFFFSFNFVFQILRFIQEQILNFQILVKTTYIQNFFFHKSKKKIFMEEILEINDEEEKEKKLFKNFTNEKFVLKII